MSTLLVVLGRCCSALWVPRRGDVLRVVVVASMCLKQVTSVPSPVPSQPEHGARCSSPGQRRVPTLQCQPTDLE